MKRPDRMSKEVIDEIFEADAAGWTVTEIANDMKLQREEIVQLFLKYERYEPNDPALNT